MNRLAERVAARYVMRTAADPHTDLTRLGDTILEAVKKAEHLDLKKFLQAWHNVGITLKQLGNPLTDVLGKDHTNIVNDTKHFLAKAFAHQEGTVMSGAMQLLGTPSFVLDALRRI